MNTDIYRILKACGYCSLKNDRENICALLSRIIREYNIQHFDHSNIIDTVIQYNGLSVDASVAMRKSMVISNFHGGFQLSLQYVIDNYEYLYDDYTETVKYTGADVLPVGNAFDDLLLINSQGEIYVGSIKAGKNWEDFLEKLISDQLKDL